MFGLFKRKKTYPAYVELPIPEGCREMTEYEKRFVVNGGSERRENSHEGVASANVGDTIERKDGTVVTLNQGDIDYAKAQLGISNSGSGTSVSGSVGGSGSSVGGSGSSWSEIGSGSSGGSSGSSGSGTSSSNDTSPAKRDSTPERESSTVLENIARYRAMAESNQIKPNVVAGKKIEGKAAAANATNVASIDPQYSSSTFRGKVSGYNAKAVSDDGGRRTDGLSNPEKLKIDNSPQKVIIDSENNVYKFYNPFKGRKKVLSDLEQSEMADKDTTLKLNEKETKVWIVRNNDNLGNSFDATRYIYKDGRLVYQDVIGANSKKEDWSKVNADSTTPDGRYYLSNAGTQGTPLYRNSDGTTDSNSYNNILSLRTNDMNLNEKERNAINYGDRHFHPNQFATAASPYNSGMSPGGLGCMIGQNGQMHQDEMMGVLMDGVYNPARIEVNIISLSNMDALKK